MGAIERAGTRASTRIGSACNSAGIVDAAFGAVTRIAAARAYAVNRVAVGIGLDASARDASVLTAIPQYLVAIAHACARAGARIAGACVFAKVVQAAFVAAARVAFARADAVHRIAVGVVLRAGFGGTLVVAAIATRLGAIGHAGTGAAARIGSTCILARTVDATFVANASKAVARAHAVNWITVGIGWRAGLGGALVVAAIAIHLGAIDLAGA